MQTHAKAVVIGGGVVGCSVLFHLARAGWSDALLIERSELTSGSSWHAAGGFHTLNGDPNVAKLQAYTVSLYKELEEISGQSCGLHLVGGAMMADTPERMDFLRLAHAKGRCMGMETELITPMEAKAMYPLMDETNFVGGMWDPVEGHLDPAGTTHAYAKAARTLGAKIELRNRVVELTQDADGTWNLRNRGDQLPAPGWSAASVAPHLPFLALGLDGRTDRALKLPPALGNQGQTTGPHRLVA